MSRNQKLPLGCMDRAPSHQKGFSVLEMVVAVAVASITAAIAVPNLAALRSHYALVAARDQVAFEVTRARMQAIAQNVHTRVVFANSGGEAQGTRGQYWMERSTDGSTFASAGPVSRLPAGIYFSVAPDAGLRFNRQGLTGGTVQLALSNSRGQTKTLSVNPLGRVELP
jgi:prepilin-type N-terminal cleavage/methylation domain-containing protein